MLDVGCGAGRLGALLKSRGIPEVHGIEQDSVAAEKARGRLDSVVQGDVERLQLTFPEGYFDCIIYADVLEHLRDPLNVLHRHKRCIADGGWVVLSVPNVRFVGVLCPLILRGEWTYQPAGVLDTGHLRFFTRRSIESLIDSAGYTVVRTMYKVPRSRRYAVPDRFTAGVLREFLSVQLLVQARNIGELSPTLSGDQPL